MPRPCPSSVRLIERLPAFGISPGSPRSYCVLMTVRSWKWPAAAWPGRGAGRWHKRTNATERSLARIHAGGRLAAASRSGVALIHAGPHLAQVVDAAQRILVVQRDERDLFVSPAPRATAPHPVSLGFEGFPTRRPARSASEWSWCQRATLSSWRWVRVQDVMVSSFVRKVAWWSSSRPSPASRPLREAVAPLERVSTRPESAR